MGAIPWRKRRPRCHRARSSPISACPPGHHHAQRHGTARSSKPPERQPIPHCARFSSPQADSRLRPALACNANSPQNLAPRANKSLDHSPVLDREFASLTPDRVGSSFPYQKKPRFKFLFARRWLLRRLARTRRVSLRMPSAVGRKAMKMMG